MTHQVWYNPADNQIMAVYNNCTYGGTRWQADGYLSAMVADGVAVSRDHKIDTLDNGVVTATSANVNPIQPYQPTLDELDTKALNELLTAEGSAVRALAEVLFQVINGTAPSNVTKEQYKNHLKSLMRT